MAVLGRFLLKASRVIFWRFNFLMKAPESAVPGVFPVFSMARWIGMSCIQDGRPWVNLEPRLRLDTRSEGSKKDLPNPSPSSTLIVVVV